MTTPAYRENFARIDWSGLKPLTRFRPRSEARSSLPLPNIVKPFSEPVQSMADGRFYNDPGSLRQSYKAENNPRGIDFTEVGDDTSRNGPERQRVTKEECAVLLDQYEAAAARGELPEVHTAD